MSFVPRELVDELAGFSRFSGSCLLCTALRAETDAGYRVVELTGDSAVLCPFWSGTPFEMLVVPLHHGAHLQRAALDELEAVGASIQQALRALRQRLGDISYNLVFHSAPYRVSGTYHWHVHILPKLTSQAGFELGTGVLINIMPPEQAASELRSVLMASQLP
jgi:UDPglucose--hexose-1-phosphate uridylyltransferase